MAQNLPSNGVASNAINSEPLSFEAAHAQLLGDKSIQFEHVTNALTERKEPPAWLKAVGNFIAEFSPIISFLFWLGLALLVGLLAYFIVTEVMGVRFFQGKPKPDKAVPVPDWQPDAREARNLLAAADALAALGQYDEAVHLILLRSIEDIDRHRPLTVRPALTARDIAAIPALPVRARPAFQRIASAVERTLFAGGSIGRDEFGGCREAYAAFALPADWQT
jgi:hypothetical protein